MKKIFVKAILFYMSSENSFIPIMYVLNDLISQSNGSELFKARLPESQYFLVIRFSLRNLIFILLHMVIRE